MSAASELFNQIGDNAFRTAIKFRRDALIQRRYALSARSEEVCLTEKQPGQRLLKFYLCHASPLKKRVFFGVSEPRRRKYNPQIPIGKGSTVGTFGSSLGTWWNRVSSDWAPVVGAYEKDDCP